MFLIIFKLAPFPYWSPRQVYDIVRPALRYARDDAWSHELAALTGLPPEAADMLDHMVDRKLTGDIERATSWPSSSHKRSSSALVPFSPRYNDDSYSSRLPHPIVNSQPVKKMAFGRYRRSFKRSTRPRMMRGYRRKSYRRTTKFGRRRY